MRFFALLDFQHMLLAFFLGLVGVITVFIAWGAYPERRPDEPEESGESQGGTSGSEPEASRHRDGTPVAPILVFIYLGVALWAIAYAIIVGVAGGPVG